MSGRKKLLRNTVVSGSAHRREGRRKVRADIAHRALMHFILGMAAAAAFLLVFEILLGNVLR